MRTSYLLALLTLLVVGPLHAQDLVITKQQDTLRCKVVSRPEGLVRIQFVSDGITIDSTLKANTVQNIVMDAYKVPKSKAKDLVPMRITTAGDTIYGKVFFENDSLVYFRHGGFTKAVPKENLLPTVSFVAENDVNKSWYHVTDEPKAKKGPTQQGYVGFLIGGINAIGIDLVYGYPVGFHVGAGIAGYTLGLRIYPIPNNSMNFNLSYKDGGFGLIKIIGGEMGGNLIPFGSNGGLHVQIGVGAVAGIDQAMSEQLFGRAETPSAVILFGVGFKIF